MLGAVIGAGAASWAAPPITPVGDIVRSPEQWYGKTVRVQSTVSRHIDHRVWEMAGGKLFVIKDDPVHPAPRPGDHMRITGTVHPLDYQTIELRLGVNIEDHFFTDDFLADDVVILVRSLVRLSWPIPVPEWFWPWARWYLHRGEFVDVPPRSGATRPDEAPLPIPDWAWQRLQVLLGAG